MSIERTHVLELNRLSVMKCADPRRNLILCDRVREFGDPHPSYSSCIFTLKRASGAKSFGRCEVQGKGEIMRILTLTVILGLPLMALGQTTEPQQTQGQTNEPQATASPKGKNVRPAQESNKQKSETDTNVRGQTNAQDVNKGQTGARSSTSQKTTVNKQEFRSRHSEVFSLGRHPKEFFIQRFGANHFRLIGNTYFIFVDTCWVAVDVDGFVYTERVICPGDADFVVVD